MDAEHMPRGTEVTSRRQGRWIRVDAGGHLAVNNRLMELIVVTRRWDFNMNFRDVLPSFEVDDVNVSMWVPPPCHWCVGFFGVMFPDLPLSKYWRGCDISRYFEWSVDGSSNNLRS
jgi:hypothetical protein